MTALALLCEPTEKVCTRCKLRHSLDAFRVNARFAGGHTTWCRTCEKAYHATWYQQTREIRIAKTKRWRQANPGRVRMHAKKWIQRHPEKRREWVKQYQLHQPGVATICRRDYNRRVAAVEEGKEQFADSRFFLLIRAPGCAGDVASLWRAALPGRRIGATELIVARYSLRVGDLKSGRQLVGEPPEAGWHVSAPEIGSADGGVIARRLARREDRLRMEALIEALQND